MNRFLIILSVLFAFACSANVEPAEGCPAATEPAPVCAATQRCMGREAGYVWAGLSTSKVGECTFYRYVCVPEGESADESCEQRWETVCAPGDVDAPSGESGE